MQSLQEVAPKSLLYLPVGHPIQEEGGHSDEEMVPRAQAIHVDWLVAPITDEYVPDGHAMQAAVPLRYVPATHDAVKQKEEPTVERLPVLQGRHVAMLDAPKVFEYVPAEQGMHNVPIW